MLGVACCRGVRGHNNSKCVQLRINSTLLHFGVLVLSRLSPVPSVVQFSSGTLPTCKCAQGSLVFEVSTGFAWLVFLVCTNIYALSW